MDSHTNREENSSESDAVWELLKASPAIKASPRFADNTLRAARTSGQSKHWWQSLFAPLPLTGLSAACTAAIAIAFFNIQPAATPPQTHDLAQAAEIEEFAETEALIAAVDHMDAFSDSELINLIGF